METTHKVFKDHSQQTLMCARKIVRLRCEIDRCSSHLPTGSVFVDKDVLDSRTASEHNIEAIASKFFRQTLCA